MLRLPWDKTVEFQSALSDMNEELLDVRGQLQAERALRTAAESIVHERQRVVDEAVKRADDATHMRDEVMKLIAQSKAAEVLPDLNKYKPVPMPTRKRRGDIFFGPKFLDTVKRVGTTDEPLKVPMPEDEVVIQ